MSRLDTATPTRDDFDSRLSDIIEVARSEHRLFVDVTAADLHRSTGGYPPAKGQHHRMPLACDAMHALVRIVPLQILYSPPSGQGARLSIRYHLSPKGK